LEVRSTDAETYDEAKKTAYIYSRDSKKDYNLWTMIKEI